MHRLDKVLPVRMSRVGVIAPGTRLRSVLVRLAELGYVHIDRVEDMREERTTAAAHLHRLHGAAQAALSDRPPDLDTLESQGRVDLLRGEGQLEALASDAVRDGEAAGLTGWCPTASLPAVASALEELGAALLVLPNPPGKDPPTLLDEHGALRRSYTPLINAYGTVPYADIDPTVPAGIAYAAMFGMMFGDIGHGALLVLAAAALRRGRPAFVKRWHRLWPFVGGAGIAAVVAGVLYGEFFGAPLLPALWLRPLDEPLTLLVAAVVVGLVLLAAAYTVATANRFREGGRAFALYAPTGGGGAALFAGAVSVGAGVAASIDPLLWIGSALFAAGLVLSASGLYAATGRGLGGAAQAGVELLDTVIRLGSNVVSFTRLAAFGLTHAALGAIVWTATVAMSAKGGGFWVAAVVVFLVGNAVAFALEALVAGVQAMRLEYYEIFSRVFTAQGRPFRPWNPPVHRTEVTP